MEAALIAPCGMNCAVCGNYVAMALDLKKKGVRKGYCPGCRPRGKNCTFMNNSCPAIGVGKYAYCYECPDFPCLRLKALDKRYRTKYHLSMIENLEFLKENGMDAFLEKEKEKWLCPECGGVITCHGGFCYRCGYGKLKTR
jgi:hypothetical protein